MSSVHDTLNEVEELLRTIKVQRAEDLLRALLQSMGHQELRVWEADVRRTIDKFLPKRRKVLTQALEKRLEAKGEKPPAGGPAELHADVAQIEADLRSRLAELSSRHIFQWSTYYRDFLSISFDRFLNAFVASSHGDEIPQILHREIAFHSNDIFGKGYRHVSSIPGNTPQHAVNKSLGGVQRFLELPIEFYSAKASVGMEVRSARGLRQLSSSFVSGILEGYGGTQFGDQSGWQLLAQYPRSWVQYSGFLTYEDLVKLLVSIESGDVRDWISRSVRPLTEALDELASGVGDYAPLPTLGVLVWEHRRLDVAVRPPPDSSQPRLIEVQCFLDAAAVSRSALEEAVGRGVAVIIAPLGSGLQEYVSGNSNLRRVVADTSEGSVSRQARRIRNILDYAIYQRRGPRREGFAPLTYNFARDFPLQDPSRVRYFQVHRSSVHDLLRTLERRTGVRLWCSVRRSGKTTACFDLGTTTGTSIVVSQTCGSTGLIPDDDRFIDEVSQALLDARPIPKSFFRDAVERCSPGKGDTGQRFVFVLDEYETLFERLKASALRDAELRYTIVQPLLNQMVAFSTSNLVVFMGQRPDAHFILMDQNQLSPYIEQDSFPLFYHAAQGEAGEFAEFVRKVLTERIEIDASFLDEVYAETSGHPFLTVNVLVSFVDWLIEHKRELHELQVSGHDFRVFAHSELASFNVSMSPEYSLFRGAVTEAMSDDMKVHDPWLYLVYSATREIALTSPDSLSCTYQDFSAIADSLGLPEMGFTANSLLSTAIQSNFLAYEDDTVRPRIRLLGRIAGVCPRRAST